MSNGNGKYLDEATWKALKAAGFSDAELYEDQPTGPIVNEADRMNSSAETIWLDRLETIPSHTVLVFTTNHPARLSQRFRDRCIRVNFESDGQCLERSARALLAAMWKSETRRTPDAQVIERLADAAIEDGRLSFRRAVQLLQKCLMEGGGQ